MQEMYMNPKIIAAIVVHCDNTTVLILMISRKTQLNLMSAY
jgi:hypothetical protein